jgi:hypothetical protein
MLMIERFIIIAMKLNNVIIKKNFYKNRKFDKFF